MFIAQITLIIVPKEGDSTPTEILRETPLREEHAAKVWNRSEELKERNTERELKW